MYAIRSYYGHRGRVVKNPRDIIIEPIVSEKSYDLIEDDNTYTFLVDRRTTKTEIKEAVEEIFSVKVVRVNTINRKGKSYNFV